MGAAQASDTIGYVRGVFCRTHSLVPADCEFYHQDDYLDDQLTVQEVGAMLGEVLAMLRSCLCSGPSADKAMVPVITGTQRPL